MSNIYNLFPATGKVCDKVNLKEKFLTSLIYLQILLLQCKDYLIELESNYTNLDLGI